MIVAWLVVILAIEVAIVLTVWRESGIIRREIVDLKRALAGLPPKPGAKPPPVDVILRRTHTREQELAFDAQLKAAHEEFGAKHQAEVERAWKAQQRRS